METRVICVGNELVCDDGVAMRVGRVLARLPLSEDVRVEFHQEVGLDLIDSIQFAGRLVLVDATRFGTEPGTCTVRRAQEVATLSGSPMCCHSLGLPELLRLAARLDPAQLPTEVVLVGIEAMHLDRFGCALSAPVRAAIPQAVRQVLEHLGASPELIARGEAEASAAASWDPTPLEAFGG